MPDEFPGGGDGSQPGGSSGLLGFAGNGAGPSVLTDDLFVSRRGYGEEVPPDSAEYASFAEDKAWLVAGVVFTSPRSALDAVLRKITSTPAGSFDFSWGGITKISRAIPDTYGEPRQPLPEDDGDGPVVYTVVVNDDRSGYGKLEPKKPGEPKPKKDEIPPEYRKRPPRGYVHPDDEDFMERQKERHDELRRRREELERALEEGERQLEKELKELQERLEAEKLMRLHKEAHDFWRRKRELEEEERQLRQRAGELLREQERQIIERKRALEAEEKRKRQEIQEEFKRREAEIAQKRRLQEAENARREKEANDLFRQQAKELEARGGRVTAGTARDVAQALTNAFAVYSAATVTIDWGRMKIEGLFGH